MVGGGVEFLSSTVERSVKELGSIVENVGEETLSAVKSTLGLPGGAVVAEDALAAAEETHDGQLNFAEFVYLLQGPLLAPFLPEAAGWADRVGEIRTLRQAFDTADADGSDEIDKDELEIVIKNITRNLLRVAQFGSLIPFIAD